MSVFEGAGQKAGLELWRIENFEAVKQPECSGKFHVGDSYLVLKTNEKGFALHFWIGNETSQDELGAVAYKAVELDAFLGGGREDCSFSCIYISFPSCILLDHHQLIYERIYMCIYIYISLCDRNGHFMSVPKKQKLQFSFKNI